MTSTGLTHRQCAALDKIEGNKRICVIGWNADAHGPVIEITIDSTDGEGHFDQYEQHTVELDGVLEPIEWDGGPMHRWEATHDQRASA